MTLRDLIEELVGAWQANDAHRAAAFFALDGIYHESGSEPILGRERIFEHFARFFHDGPAWRFEIDEMVVEGQRAAVGYRFGVNRDGTWNMRCGCALVRGEHSLIAQWREYRG